MAAHRWKRVGASAVGRCDRCGCLRGVLYAFTCRSSHMMATKHHVYRYPMAQGPERVWSETRPECC